MPSRSHPIRNSLAPPAGQANPKTPVARPLILGSGPEYDQAAVARGQKLFQANCQFCHGATAKGGEGGPDLLRSLVVLHDKAGDLIGPVVHNGRPDKGMPKFALTDDQIRDVATFLHQKVKDAAERGTYQILNIVTGNAAKGEAYFNGPGQCTRCHSVTGDLAHIAAKLDAVDIQQKIVMPRSGQNWMRHEPTPAEAADHRDRYSALGGDRRGRGCSHRRFQYRDCHSRRGLPLIRSKRR